MTEMTEYGESEQNFLNISIKEEPLDDYELPENLLRDVKEEPKDDCVAEEPLLYPSNFNDTLFISNTDVTATSTNNAGAKTSINNMVLNDALKASENTLMEPDSSCSDNSILKVQCPRCKNTVVMEEFRRHIDSCPPRKSTTKRSGKTFSDSFDNPTTSLDNTESSVDSMFPDSTVERTLFARTSDRMETRNGLLVQARRTRSKSCYEVSFNNHVAMEEPKGSSKRTRSKSMYKEMESDSVNADSYRPKSVEGHTSQTASQQKALNIRSKSVSNSIILSKKPISSEENEDQSNGDPKNITDQSANALDGSLLLEDNTFSCYMCSFTTDKQRTLRDHERHHKKKSSPVFQCIYCNQKYTRYALYLHIQKVHPGQKFEIVEDNHANKNNVELTCISKNCGFVGKSLKHLQQHSKTHLDEEGRNDESIFRCTRCSYTSKYKMDILKHDSSHREGLLILKCSSCNFISTLNAVRDHEKSCGINGKSPAKPVYYGKEKKCPDCSYIYRAKSKLQIHKRNHTKNMPILSCSNNCGFKSTSSALQAHFKKCKQNSITKTISLKTNGNMFKCLKCSFTTNLRIKLNFHNRKRHCKPIIPSLSRRTLKCSICPFSASIQRHFDLHMKKHGSSVTLKQIINDGHSFDKLDSTIEKNSNGNNEKFLEYKKRTFKCSHCPFLTNLRIKLNIHMRTHNVQMYKNKKDSDSEHSLLHCNQCTFTTDIPYELETHIKMPHINLFHCTLCSAIFDRQHHLDRHMRIHQLNKPIWKCPSCNFMSSRQIFNSHMQKHLKVNPSLKWFMCKMCSYVALKEGQLNRHLATHESHQPVKKCPYCAFTSTTRQLIYHVFQHNNCIKKQQNNGDKSKQNVASVETSGNVKTSTNSKRVSISNLDKPIVKVSTSELNKFVRELSSPKLKELGKQKLLKCKFCSANSMSFTSLQNHIRAHITKQPINQCRYCTFKSTPNSLIKHIRKHHRQEMLKVAPERQTDIGSKTSESKSVDNFSCEKHLKVHIQKQPTKQCPYCNLCFIARDLANHNCSVTKPESSHGIQTDVNKETSGEQHVTKSKLLKCRFCSVAGNAGNLKQHMRMHLNNQPIKKCELCNFKSTPNALMHHIMYKCKKSFRCKLCSFTALQHNDLENHVRTHHKEQSINQCPYCTFKSTPSSLTKHIASHDSQENDNESTSTIQKNIDDENLSTKNQISAPVVRNTDSLSIKPKNHHESRLSDRKRKRVIAKKVSNNEIKSVDKKNIESTGFCCSLCSYSTDLRIKLNIHKRKRHPVYEDEETRNTKRRKLDNQSEKSCLSPDSDRQRAKKITETRDSKEGILYCSFCSFTSSMRSSWKKHLSSHMTYNLPIFQCQYCGFKGTLHAFRSHGKTCAFSSDRSKKNPPQKILLTCAKCSFTTYFPAALENHKKNDHTDTKSIQNLGAIKSFQCEYCSFSSYWQYLIERHQLSHTVLKLAVEQCPNCEFRSTTAALQAHINKCTKKSQQHVPSDSVESK